MLTQQDTNPETLEQWASRHDISQQALCLALEKMAEASIQSLLKEVRLRDRGDGQNIIEMCDQQDLKNYFVEQIRFIPFIHEYIGAVVGPNPEGLTPLYRQAQTCPWQKPTVVPWQNPAWVFAQWQEYFLSKHTEYAEESADRPTGSR